MKNIRYIDKKDVETVKNVLLKLKKNHTIIVIDREQNIYDEANHIIVIDEHTVKEEGTRKQLLKKQLIYSNLVGNNQKNLEEK